MVITIYLVWLLIYILPFMLIIVSWNRRSLLVIAGMIATLIGLLWIDLFRVPFMDRHLGWDFAEIFLVTISYGAAAGAAARGITLAVGWKPFSTFGIVTTFLALAATPVVMTAMSI